MRQPTRQPLLLASHLPARPRTRGECAPNGNGPWSHRPCPFVTCRHHLAIDVLSSGSISSIDGGGGLRADATDAELENFAERISSFVAEAAGPSCSLDVADVGPHALVDVGEVLRVTRERVRQIQGAALRRAKLAAGRQLRTVLDGFGEDDSQRLARIERGEPAID